MYSVRHADHSAPWYEELHTPRFGLSYGVYNSTTQSGCLVLSLMWLSIVHAISQYSHKIITKQTSTCAPTHNDWVPSLVGLTRLRLAAKPFPNSWTFFHIQIHTQVRSCCIALYKIKCDITADYRGYSTERPWWYVYIILFEPHLLCACTQICLLLCACAPY